MTAVKCFFALNPSRVCLGSAAAHMRSLHGCFALSSAGMREDAFYVADMGEVYRQHLRWKMNLARVKPFYGMLLEF